MSFTPGVGLLERAGLATVGLNVLQVGSPAIGPIRATISQVEHEHARSELSFFEHARGFPDITGFVVNELAALRLDIAMWSRVYLVSDGRCYCQAQLQLEIGALLGRTAATTFTSTVESPTRETMPTQVIRQ